MRPERRLPGLGNRPRRCWLEICGPELTWRGGQLGFWFSRGPFGCTLCGVLGLRRVVVLPSE